MIDRFVQSQNLLKEKIQTVVMCKKKRAKHFFFTDIFPRRAFAFSWYNTR